MNMHNIGQFADNPADETAGAASDEMSDSFSDQTHSKVIRMSSGRFISELIFRYAWIWILSLSLLAVIGLILGITVDIRWIVVALMVVCLVGPGLLTFLYYYHGLKRGCYVNTIPHRIVITQNGLIIRMQIAARDSSGFETGEDREDNSRQEASVPEWRDEFFPYSSLTPFVIGNNSAIVPLRKPESGFIWIPADAFTNKDHLSQLLQLLDSKVTSTT